MCGTGSIPGFQSSRKAPIRPVSWQNRYIDGSVCSRFTRICGVQNGSSMVTAFQETGVHVAPSCFVDVGKKDPCPDEGNNISKTFSLRNLPTARPDDTRHLGEERIASSQTRSYSFRPPAKPSTICRWKKRNLITAGSPPSRAEAMICTYRMPSEVCNAAKAT